MRLEFIGAAHEVTGSCHFLQIGDYNLLVDCGMEQGADLYENQEIPVNPGDIDYILITHAHIDHSGLLPLMTQKGFKGQIYCTTATHQLCNIMLKDSAHIQEQEAEWKNRKAKRACGDQIAPLYTLDDVERTLRLFVPVSYGTEIELNENIKICFHDAGHLLGSAFIMITATENNITKKLLFSGDLGHGNRALIKNPELPEAADYVIIESTYGDRLHQTPPDYATTLAGVIRSTFNKGGNVVIPAFSVGRTQELLYYMRQIKQNNLLPEYEDFEVYIDSPMAIEATNIFTKNVDECFNDACREMVHSGVNPITFPGLKTAITSDDSKMINFLKKPVVIISASGMCEAGRIRHHLKYNLWKPEATVVFVGFQCQGTLGAKLLEGVSEVKLFGEPVGVRATIMNLPGISGHADKDRLTAWLGSMPKKPKHVFVVHGDDQVTDGFAAHLQQELLVKASAPYSGDVYDLITEEWALRPLIKRAEKKAPKKTNTVYDRLLAAGERLLAVIRKNKEGANKDLAKFADQIMALCDKWDRK